LKPAGHALVRSAGGEKGTEGGKKPSERKEKTLETGRGGGNGLGAGQGLAEMGELNYKKLRNPSRRKWKEGTNRLKRLACHREKITYKRNPTKIKGRFMGEERVRKDARGTECPQRKRICSDVCAKRNPLGR